MWRHGDRTPITLLPNDTINNEKSWEIGLGELTVTGIWEAYRLGKLLRQRYDGFLSGNYKTSEIYVRSTDINRTLMTANGVLQGLYPQRYSDDKSSTVWHPVPLLRQSLNCPKANDELRKVYKMKEIEDVAKMNEEFLKYLGKNMGIKGKYDLANIWYVYDPLEVITHHRDRHQFPKWVNGTVWHKIEELYNFLGQYQYQTDLLKRLRAGELWEEILIRLKNLKEQGLSQKQKMYAYSAHDETVAALLNLLGMQLTTFPPYASVVLLEMHQINNEFILQLYYKNVTDSNQIYQFPIGYCDDSCTVEKLRAATKKFISNNWAVECNNSVRIKK
uniref:Lysosomal acid phosphatase n=1 Tax=Setaria digitata TaxID=48799 RepID=A0A915PT05_9BILA